MAWLVYDGICRATRNEVVLTAALLGPTTLAAWGATELFAPRAAYVQVGAMLGTIMVANVFFVIIPAHRRLIRAKEAYREPDPGPALEAKRRSVHNNYLTLPVVFAMLSNHFPAAYTHSYSWLVLVALMAIGAWIRHFFNLRHAGRNVWWTRYGGARDRGRRRRNPADRRLRRYGGGGRLGVVHAGAGDRPATVRAVPFGAPDARVRRATRDRARHGGPDPRAGRGPDRARCGSDSQLMPLGNATGMTQAERDELGAPGSARGGADQVGSRGAGDRLGRLPLRHAARGGARVRDGGRVPASAAAGEPDPFTRAGAASPAGSRSATSTSALGPRTPPATRPPGQLLFYPGGVSETEILFPYGPTAFASKAGLLAGKPPLRDGVGKASNSWASSAAGSLWQGAQPLRAAES